MFAHEFGAIECGLILLSGVFDAAGYCVGFALAGKSELITKLGIVRVAAVLIVSFVIFEEKGGEMIGMTVRKIIGLITTMIGTVLYLIFERKNQEIEERARVVFLEEEEQIEPPVLLHVKGVEFKNADTGHDE